MDMEPVNATARSPGSLRLSFTKYHRAQRVVYSTPVRSTSSVLRLGLVSLVGSSWRGSKRPTSLMPACQHQFTGKMERRGYHGGISTG